MKNHFNHQRFGLRPLIAAMAIASAVGGANAADLAESSGLFEYSGANPNDTQLFKNLGLTLGGWINAGITYNGTNSKNGFNGMVTFGDRDSEPQLNQLYLYLQRAVATSGDDYSFGGRFDFMYGSDSIFTQAYGNPFVDPVTGHPEHNRGSWDLNILSHNGNRFYDIALPQAYGEAYIPIGNGLNIKAGHFYTPVGYEVVTAPDNFFYSKPYTFQYGEPFTHTGLLGTYNFDDNWQAMAGAVTGSNTGGWDGNFDRNLGNWSFLGGGTWTSTDKATSAFVSGTAGQISERDHNLWAEYSVVLKHNVTDALHLVLQHDHGFANNLMNADGVNRDSQWYGINSYVFYDIDDKLSFGVRGEWWRDNNGVRTSGPGARNAASSNYFSNSNNFTNYAFLPGANLCSNSNQTNCTSATLGASYYEITAGFVWKPLKMLKVRPNVRYDWVEGVGFFSNGTTGAYHPYANGKSDQVIFSTDVVLSF